jgi:SAM-dependent methyltransferase
MSAFCPACDSARVVCVGQLPNFTDQVIGESSRVEIGHAFLYRCRDCSLRFRHPAPSGAALRDYYGGLTGDDWWQYEEEREVWRHLRAELEGAPTRKVLDVGCFRGDLLAHLGDGWEKFGIEPSIDARLVAETRSVHVLAETVEALDREADRFGAITMIDVIEHLPRPLEALRKLASMLEPGGRLVIFTGATDALSWRFAGTLYWYSAMPEHVVFFRPSWFQRVAPQLGCKVSSVQRLPFRRAGARERVNEALMNILYVSCKRLEALPVVGRPLRRLPIVGRILRWRGSWWTTARDHTLITLVRG